MQGVCFLYMVIHGLLDTIIKEILTHSMKEVWRILLTNDKIGLNTVATTRRSTRRLRVVCAAAARPFTDGLA